MQGEKKVNQQISVATTTGRISWSDNFRIGVRLLPIKYSTEGLQERFSRQDRQGRKGNFFSISPNFAPFAPWNSLTDGALVLHSCHYYTGRAPCNTDSTKIELFARSAIPRGESPFVRFPKPKFNGIFQICLVTLLTKQYRCAGSGH